MLFFLGLLFTGLRIYDDYGVHWDEYNNQSFGDRWSEYVLTVLGKGLASDVRVSIEPGHDMIHGAVFELFLKFSEKMLFVLSDSRDIILMRHLTTFLIFYVAIFFFYLLCDLYFKNWKIALLGSLFLVLHPRIFANSFYNSVDIPFLAFYIISTYTLIRYLEKKTYLRAVFCALACAILIDIRIIGAILPFSALVFLVIDIMRSRKDAAAIKKIVMSIIMYVLFLAVLIVLLWPLLWEDRFNKIYKAISHTAHYRYCFTPVSPWYYYFKWIVITTPLLYSFCFFGGVFVSIKAMFKGLIRRYDENRPMLIAVVLFFVPITLLAIFKERSYNGWRHLYFIYPVYIIFCLKGVTALYKFISVKYSGRRYKIINAILILTVGYSAVNTLFFMVKYHPHEHVYANALSGRGMALAKDRLTLDYWGLSFRKAMEYILENDKSPIIHICTSNLPAWDNVNILPREERKRLVYTENIDEADYFLGNYKSIGKYQWARGEYPDKEEYYSVKVGETKFMVVYKLK
ncbi:MAG: glycosyltransferase family 39 protein [Candidatus Omnitrophica bacterium]|nr:glycosyltransferase family 39 protein [Candidatus Omnitrophota bacterium]